MSNVILINETGYKFKIKETGEIWPFYSFNAKYNKIAEEMRKGEIHLLWLPVAHCEQNPIELIWAYVKKDVAKKAKPSNSRMFETCVRNP